MASSCNSQQPNSGGLIPPRIPCVPLLLVGPSTVGKSTLALAIARKLCGEIVNADKFYLYNGFPATTGLPDFNHYRHVPTHLFEILDPAAPCPTAAEFAGLATTAIDSIVRRSSFPIFEGCYHRFARALIELVPCNNWIVAGLRWPSETNVARVVEQRVEDVFHTRHGIEEVRNALARGHRETYVMREGSMIRPLVEFVDGVISLELAKAKAVAEILSSAYKALRKFLDFGEIRWFDCASSNVDTIVPSIVDSVVAANPMFSTSTSPFVNSGETENASPL